MASQQSKCPAFGSGWAFMIFLAGLICLTACTERADPTPFPTRMRVSVTPPAEPVRTLPPTWTPTSTWTPRPPSPTATVTLTPTITPTLDPAQVCEDFQLFAAPDNGIRVDYDGLIAFSWQNAPPNAEIHIAILNSETDEGILVRWPAQQSLNMPVEMSYLPAPGRYEWQLTIYDEASGELCPVEGWFVRKPSNEKSPTPTSETPSATPSDSDP